MKQQTMTGVLCAGLFTLGISTANAAPVSGQGTWETTLQGRDLDGNAATFEAYYDTTLDITWLADANYAKTSGYDDDGRMTWGEAKSWVDTLNAANHLGYSDWRLPKLYVDSCNFTYNGTGCGYNVLTGSEVEMASLWYDTLGNIAYYDTAGNGPQPGFGLTNTGPFSNIEQYYYWSGQVGGYFGGGIPRAYYFNAFDGSQSTNPRSEISYAWAVRSGDVSAVPVPAAVWLFGSALIGLLGVAKRKR